jgi:hypothetical protein
VIVYERKGGLSQADRARVIRDQRSFSSDRRRVALAPQKPVFSPNGNAAVVTLRSRAPATPTASRRRWTRSASA